MSLTRVGLGGYPLLMDKIGFWNTNGLNKVSKQREMHLFLHNAKVGLFGLLKTKTKRHKAQEASLNLCTRWSFFTNMSEHSRGRIWLLFNLHIFEINIMRVSAQSIQCKVKHRGTRHHFCITIVYWFNDQVVRRELWKELEDISKQRSMGYHKRV